MIGSIHRIVILHLALFCGLSVVYAQNHNDSMEYYRKSIEQKMQRYSSEVERKCSDYIREVWRKYEAYAPLSVPKDDIKPIEYKTDVPILEVPVDLHGVCNTYNSNDAEPIETRPHIQNTQEAAPADKSVKVSFYGMSREVASPELSMNLKSLSNDDIADAWDAIERSKAARTLNDCCTIRMQMHLCDWAYLNFLMSVSTAVFPDNTNNSTLFTTYLWGKSGYDFRLGRGSGRLYLIYSCSEEIYGQAFYRIDGEKYYLLSDKKDMPAIDICPDIMFNEKPLSLVLDHEQVFDLDEEQKIINVKNDETEVLVSANSNILSFYSSYPIFRIGNNDMTRYAMYAQTPIDAVTRESLYPYLQARISRKTIVDAANVLLNFVQTGFAYMDDEKYWGEDRVFFAEETLVNPYCDCDDKSILFSHLIRDLLGLDVILIYTTNHIFTGVKFPCEVPGSFITVGNEKYMICEPTCSSAVPVGWSGIEDTDAELRVVRLNRIQYSEDYSVSTADQRVKSLFPLFQNGKWGYRNADGDIVVPCEYEWVSDYEQGDKFCYVASKGDVLTLFHENGQAIPLMNIDRYIPLECNVTDGGRYDFSAIVRFKDSGDWICIDLMIGIDAEGDYLNEYCMDGVTYEDHIYCAPLDGKHRIADKFVILKKKETGKYGVLRLNSMNAVVPFEYDSIIFVKGDKSKVVLKKNGVNEIFELN